MVIKYKWLAIVAIVVIVLIVFYQPLWRLLDRASSDASSVRVGNVEIIFNKQGLRQIEPPSRDIDAVLPVLTSTARNYLIAVTPSTPANGLCTRAGYRAALSSPDEEGISWRNNRQNLMVEYNQYLESYEQLAEVGLVELRPGQIQFPHVCAEGEGRNAHITELGQRVRQYYLELLDRALNFQPATPST